MKLAVVGKQFLQDVVLTRSFLWRLPAGRESALTFDDGPHPLHTPALLELLQRHGIHANFFLIGERAAAHPDHPARLQQVGEARAANR
jgi:peptidoglycan/xylan/chitin deacetylase (PgdA/CDA1 family)